MDDLSDKAKKLRKPLPPEELFDAKFDRLHKKSSKARAARTVKSKSMSKELDEKRRIYDLRIYKGEHLSDQEVADYHSILDDQRTDAKKELKRYFDIISSNPGGSDRRQFAYKLLGIINGLHGFFCKDCRNSGTKQYHHSSTWRGGMGVGSHPFDICNVCWGSGSSDYPNINLRDLLDEVTELRKLVKELECEETE